VKKDGRALRRATGKPPWSQQVQTMEVLDGSKFGIPGDDEKYPTKQQKKAANSKEGEQVLPLVGLARGCQESMQDVFAKS
jgi:hypothetical protein